MAKPNGKNGKPKASPIGNSSRETLPKESDKQSASSSGAKKSRTAHLAPWQFKPGQSGNPKGGPKKPSLVRALTQALERAEKSREKGDPVARHPFALGEGKRPPTIDELAEAMLVMGAAGNLVALGVLEKLLDRFDGRVPIKAELTGKDGDAITIRSARDNIGERLAGQIARTGADADTSEPN